MGFREVGSKLWEELRSDFDVMNLRSSFTEG